jgi:hypothetical protein
MNDTSESYNKTSSSKMVKIGFNQIINMAIKIKDSVITLEKS